MARTDAPNSAVLKKLGDINGNLIHILHDQGARLDRINGKLDGILNDHGAKLDRLADLMEQQLTLMQDQARTGGPVYRG